MSLIRQQTFLGVKWIAVSQISRLITQSIGGIVLARFLPASDFGLLAMASVVIGFVNLFCDFGSAAALIQKPILTPKLLNSVFWLNVIFGFGFAVILGILSPIIAFGFAEPRLKEVLWILALTFPIVSLGTVHQALLEKSSRFRPLAIIESIAAIVGVVGAILAAWAGCGVYSLVVQTSITVFFTTANLWRLSKWRPSFQWDTREIGGTMKFSGNLVGFNMFSYFIRNVDNLIVGRFLGSADLGYYSMAYRLMLLPLQNISNVLGRALFPVFSQLHDNHDRLGEAYTRATAAITLITAPLMFGFFVLREPFVLIILGEDWRPIIEILTWLVPVGLVQSIGTSVGTLYLASGRTDVMFKWGVIAGLFVIPALVLGLQWGVMGVAISYAGATLLLFLPGLVIPFRLVGLKVGNVLLKLIPSVLTAAVMALVVFELAATWPINSDNQLLRLFMLITAGIITYSLLSLFTQRTLLKDVIRAISNR